jgi:hypothetical protein
MSASISSAKSKRGKLVPLPNEIIKAIDEAHEKLKMEHVNESILFQSQKAKNGFKQADVVLTKGTLYEDFTKEEEDKILQEQERQRKVKKSYDTLIADWKEENNKKLYTKNYSSQRPTYDSRTIAKIRADQTSRAYHDRVVNGLSDGVDARRRVAVITDNYMTGQYQH